MKKNGILNSHISKVLSDLGHTDKLVIADAGLPVPEHVLKIDLALKFGTPSFQEVVDVVLEDMSVEQITIASEVEVYNKDVSKYMDSCFSGISVERVTHDEFKRLMKDVKVVIRTGEITPYANCILHSGVFF